MKISPAAPNEVMRLSALRSMNILDRGKEEDFDDITGLAAQICDTPLALIVFVDEQREWIKSVVGLLPGETITGISFCARLMNRQGILVVPDTSEDEGFKDDPQVTGAPFARLYAGAPILSAEGFVLGALIVIDRKPGYLTDRQISALQALARQVETLLMLRTKLHTSALAEERPEVFNSHFRLVLEKIGDNVWEYDFRTGISSFSRNENNLLGFNLDNPADINAMWWKSIHPADRGMLEENDRKCRLGQVDSHCLEYRLILKDGSVKWVLDRGVVIEKTAGGLPLKLIGTHTDITSLKENGEALKESQQRWKFALEGSGDGIWDWNIATGKVFYSKRWKEMLGYAEEEIDDNLRTWELLVHPDDRAGVKNELQIHFSSAMPFYQSEHRLLCKDGTYKWILDRGMVIERDTANQPLRIIGTHTDISPIKFTELALEQRLKQFKSLSDNIPGVIYEYEFKRDGSEGLRYISPAVTRLFGISREDSYDFYNFIHPGDVGMIESKNKISNETLEPFYCEARLIVPGRGLLWCSLTASFSYWTENGSKVFTGFMLDITEKKNSDDQLKMNEEKYRSIIANMNLGLLEVDLDENILFANQSFCDMSGYENEELVNSKPNEIFILGENRDLMKIKSESRREGVSDAYEIAIKNKRGQLRWWLISGAPRYDDSGELLGSIGIHLDITKQKELEIELIGAREQAEESTRSKEVFLANMSHEIRTPMNAIVGMSNQLAKTNLDTSQKFYLDTINTASENLLFIINDILDLSKIEAGKLQIERIGFEPAEMVKRAVRVLSHRAEEKGLIITSTGFDATLAPVLMGDPFRLNQVLLNLFNNAIKFTEKGSIGICCQVLKDSGPTQTIRIAVKDTGIGMEEWFVKNLFEKFTQEDASITRQYGGTGLGMSISKDLVELMGGEIQVESKKGVGTTISFIIEFEKGGPQNLPVKQTFTLDANMLSGTKILVVDDNKMNRLVAATILKNYGAVISESVNGQEAVETLIAMEFDLVLMDIQMPVMDGMEATAIIRQSISKSLPIIALTANAIKGDNIKYIEAGMNDYLSKPFKEKDLLNVVAFWLAKNKKMREGGESPETIPGRLYDLSVFEAMSPGDAGFVEKMAGLFVIQTPAHVAEMEERYHQGDYRALAALAGKLKQVVDNMGISSLKDPVREIEKKAKLEADDTAIPVHLKLIRSTVEAVAGSLKKAYPGNNTAP